MQPSEEVPVRQFRGIWTPPELFDFLFQKIISPRELVLLALIDSLVKTRGDGCWASNAYLGSQMGGLSPNHISAMVKHLKDLGLVSHVGTKRVNGQNMRLLETKWSSAIGKVTENRKGELRFSVRKALLLRNSSNTKENPGGGRPGGTNGGNDMPFFPELSKRKGTIRFDDQCAKQLRSATTDAGRKQGWTMKKWSNDFRILRKTRSIGEIQTLLDWYSENAKNIRKPSVYNAKHFRNPVTFDWLWELMEKDPTRLDVSPEAEDIAKRLKKYHWPKGSSIWLKEAVQKTLTGFQCIKERIKEWAFPYLPEHGLMANGERPSEYAKIGMDEVLYLAEWLAKRNGINAVSETERWFVRLFNRVHGWDDWNGNLIAEAFSGDVRDKRLHKLGSEWAARVGSANNWQKLTELL